LGVTCLPAITVKLPVPKKGMSSQGLNVAEYLRKYSKYILLKDF
jgi:hypothetical protein